MNTIFDIIWSTIYILENLINRTFNTIYNVVYDVVFEWRYGNLKETILHSAILLFVFYILALWAAI